LKNLSVLNLGFNKLRELPDSIGNLENLAELGFNSNQLEMLPDSIGNLKKLTVLDLHGNKIKELPETVKELASSLKELHLTDNPITNDKEAMEKIKGWLPNTNIVFK